MITILHCCSAYCVVIFRDHPDQIQIAAVSVLIQTHSWYKEITIITIINNISPIAQIARAIMKTCLHHHNHTHDYHYHNHHIHNLHNQGYIQEHHCEHWMQLRLQSPSPPRPVHARAAGIPPFK